MTPLYTAVASATSGREGRVKSDDGHLEAALSIPRGLGGPGGAGTNPEQLFAAGYAACFGSALKLVAGQQKIDAGQFTITARVTLGKGEKGYALAVVLEGSIPAVSREKAHALMEAAHQVCPYSNATRGNIEVTLTVA